MSEWAPVIAALGTGAFGFGAVAWQQNRREATEADSEKSECYHALIAHSLSFGIRSRTLRDLMQVRSGVANRLDVKIRLREKPEVEIGSGFQLDPLELHDWLSRAYEPVNDAWAKVQMVGSAEAIEIATRLLEACGDVLQIATHPGTARGRGTAFVIGLRWTADEAQELEAASQRIVEHRQDLIRLARKELRKRDVQAPREGADLNRPTAQNADMAER